MKYSEFVRQHYHSVGGDRKTKFARIAVLWRKHKGGVASKQTGAGFFDDVASTVGKIGRNLAPFAPLAAVALPYLLKGGKLKKY